MEAILALEDGRLFNGHGYGARGARGGEVVFNTSITGYQEIVTDPSYCGQIVCLTYPHIGNVGANALDDESERPWIEALVVRDFTETASNWRSEQEADAFLEAAGIPVISHIDTRALVLHLRKHGALRAMLSTDSQDGEALVRQARELPKMVGRDLAREVTTKRGYEWKDGSDELSRINVNVNDVNGSPNGSKNGGPDKKYRVVAYDFGIKRSILRRLVDVGCDVAVVPATTSAEDVLAMKPDGVFLSNGPGDPEPCTYAIDSVRKLMGKVPIFGICLGHQIIGLALGGKTFKLKFGHHGGNHPVKNLQTGKVEITAQNHGFCVDPDSLDANDVELTHINLNDQTLEGLRHKSLPLFSVQYHPEASPGPHDSNYLFSEFTQLMRNGKCG